MANTKCGFNDMPGGASGATLLSFYGPTLGVNIGFDPNYRNVGEPVPGITGIRALVDTGTAES